MFAYSNKEEDNNNKKSKKSLQNGLRFPIDINVSVRMISLARKTCSTDSVCAHGLSMCDQPLGPLIQHGIGA